MLSLFADVRASLLKMSGFFTVFVLILHSLTIVQNQPVVRGVSISSRPIFQKWPFAFFTMLVRCLLTLETCSTIGLTFRRSSRRITMTYRQPKSLKEWNLGCTKSGRLRFSCPNLAS